MTIMTLDESIRTYVSQYCNMYISSSYDDLKFKFLDQTLNVLGNGINDDSDFGVHFAKQPNVTIPEIPPKYYDGTPLFQGYTEIDHNISAMTGKPFPNFDSRFHGLYTQEELKSIEHMVALPYTTRGINPYPNFTAEYSVFYQLSDELLSQLDKSWLHGMLWFYERSQQYFNSDECIEYHHAAPAEDDVEGWAKLIKQYETSFARYVGDNEEERNAIITKEYELEYTGDTKAFIIKRWKIEHERINTFLVQVIADINSRLDK